MRGTMKTKSLVFVTLLVAALMFASIQGCATSPAQPMGDWEQKIDQAVSDFGITGMRRNKNGDAGKGNIASQKNNQ